MRRRVDIFQVAHSARVGQQLVMGTLNHYRIANSDDLLKIACNGGARALGLEQSIGSLEEGKKADIILIDANEPDQIPIYDPLFTAANMTTGQNVSSVIIDGNIVMKERKLLSMDIEQIKANLAQRLPIIMDRFEEVMK